MISLYLQKTDAVQWLQIGDEHDKARKSKQMSTKWKKLGAKGSKRELKREVMWKKNGQKESKKFGNIYK